MLTGKELDAMLDKPVRFYHEVWRHPVSGHTINDHELVVPYEEVSRPVFPLVAWSLCLAFLIVFVAAPYAPGLLRVIAAYPLVISGFKLLSAFDDFRYAPSTKVFPDRRQEEARLKLDGYVKEKVFQPSRYRTQYEREAILLSEARAAVRKAVGTHIHTDRMGFVRHEVPDITNRGEMEQTVASRECLKAVLDGKLSLIVHSIANDYGQSVLVMFLKPMFVTEKYPFGWVFDPSVPGYVPRQRDVWESMAPTIHELPQKGPFGDNEELSEADLVNMGALHPMPKGL